MRVIDSPARCMKKTRESVATKCQFFNDFRASMPDFRNGNDGVCRQKRQHKRQLVATKCQFFNDFRASMPDFRNGNDGVCRQKRQHKRQLPRPPGPGPESSGSARTQWFKRRAWRASRKDIKSRQNVTIPRWYVTTCRTLPPRMSHFVALIRQSIRQTIAVSVESA
jgi:hypothetical protein